MAIATKEIHRGTSYTEGTTSRRYDRARIVVFVTGLADTRDQLDQAITSARTGRLVHPDNTALPLRYATARWVRGDDGGACEGAALVDLIYDKNGSQQATDSTEFSVIADIDVYHAKKFWYGETLADPSGVGTGNGSTAVYETLSPFAPTGPPTYPGHLLTETYMRIRVPVVLSSSPIGDSFDEVGTVNDGSFTISNKAFAANSLRFDGLAQRATKIDDGSSVTYEFEVSYQFTYAAHGWYYSRLYDNSGTLNVVKELEYAETTWTSGDFPTS
jgi:hypothetical protein